MRFVYLRHQRQPWSWSDDTWLARWLLLLRPQALRSYASWADCIDSWRLLPCGARLLTSVIGSVTHYGFIDSVHIHLFHKAGSTAPRPNSCLLIPGLPSINRWLWRGGVFSVSAFLFWR